MKTLPHITSKQQALIRLIYRYRFLERSQIQILLHHKDKRRISAWLKDLREKQYIDWIYQPDDPIESTKPAIYYLGLNGIRYLSGLDAYPAKELRKRYSESSRTRTFVDRCLLVADCCITLQAESSDKIYSYVLPPDYANDTHLIGGLKPHLFFSKQQDDETTNYVLENFEQTLPRYQLRKRLKDYVGYLSDHEGGEMVVALFICASTADLLYAKRRIKAMLEDSPEDLNVRVSTLDKLRSQGLTGTIWEDVT